MIQCRNSIHLPVFVRDAGTGRARFPPRLFSKLKLKLGAIIQLDVAIEGGDKLGVLCTAWPISFSSDNDSDEDLH
jgi:hypothetical protein